MIFVIILATIVAFFYFGIGRAKSQKKGVEDYWDDVMYFVVSPHPEHPEYWVLASMFWSDEKTGDPEQDMHLVTTIPGSFCSLGHKIGNNDTTFIWFSKDDALRYAKSHVEEKGGKAVSVEKIFNGGEAFEVRGKWD